MELHPNWQYLINRVAEYGYGRIEELSFEKGVPVFFKVAVQSINIAEEIKKKGKQ